MTVRSRLQIGLDVPWVTSWSNELKTRIGRCPSIGGGLAVQQEQRPGEGRPNYSRNHLDRQRLSVRRMLCPMCGEPTRAGDRWTATGRLVSAGDLRRRGLAAAAPAELSDERMMLDAGAISPSHRACLDLALARCPHLAEHASAPIAFPDRWIVVPLTVEAKVGAPAPHALVLTRPASIAVVSFLQLCAAME